MAGGWIKDHKRELLAALALGGLGVATGGFGLLGGASAAAGAEAGAGAAAGGLAGADAVGAGAGAMPLSAADAFPLVAGGEEATGGLLGRLGPALDRFGKMQRIAGLLAPPQPEAAPPLQMPQGGGPALQPLAQTQPMPTLQQMYGPQVIDDETRRRRMRMRGLYG